MKALSIRQPWAWLICVGYKDVENRSWRTKFRGRIYVHAGKTKDTTVPQHSLFGETWMLDRLSYGQRLDYFVARKDRGAIIGEVDIVDCLFRDPDEVARIHSRWAEPGQYGFILASPVLYQKPIPCRGMLGFFEPDIHIESGKDIANETE